MMPVQEKQWETLIPLRGGNYGTCEKNNWTAKSNAIRKRES